MKKLYQPTWMVDSIFQLSPKSLQAKGLAGVIVDLDNTLLAWNELDYTPQLQDWIQAMVQAQIKVFVLSNNSQSRVHRAVDALDVPYSASALKPSRRKFRQALASLNLPKDQVVVVGDQIMTDIIGANRMGLKSILVKPIADNDNLFTYGNRFLERMLLWRLGIQRKENWGNQLD